MMHEEFETLAGYEVSHKTYHDIIEPMYMALPEGITKQQFVKMLDKKAFALPTKAQMVKAMRKIAQEIFENCGRCCFYEEEDEMMRIAYEYAERFYGVRRDDLKAWVFACRHSACYGVFTDRGCTCPTEIVIGRDTKHGEIEYERIKLIKEDVA